MKRSSNQEQTLTTKPALSLRARALGYLARREYSRKELEQKLSRFAEENDDLPALLDDFLQRGWLSEQRFTEQLTHARQSRFGSLRIAHELREHGVAEELVEQALAELKDGELDHARSVQQKKFGGLPENHEAWTKQARFLQGRGFSFDVIKQVLKPDPDETV